ncbi:MAG: hypothetical protein HRU01_28350 [Myxococcales bacterium]|nr:hypothetical protein [Myxococcales bacterium]
MPWVLAQRDVAILSAAAALWWVVANGSIGDAGVLSVIVGVLAGIFLGLTWGYAAHEWGHFLGARLARSHIQVSEHRTAIQLFRFDPRDNTRVQFLCMAWGGLIVLWAQAGLFTWLLPWRGASGVTAIAFALLGAVYTTWVEGPIVLRVHSGGEIPSPASAASDREGGSAA